MWKSLLFVLLCQFATAWSQVDIAPSDVGKTVNIYRNLRFPNRPTKIIFSDNRDWVDELPKKEYFKPNTYTVGSSSSNYLFDSTNLAHEYSFIDVCDSVEELLKYYFRYIELETLPNSQQFTEAWKLFTESWTTSDIADKFGIPEDYVLSNNYNYILVKIFLQTSDPSLTDVSNIKLSDNASADYGKINNNDHETLLAFVERYGSHWISSYAAGGVLHQVFVYDKNEFASFGDEIRGVLLNSMQESQKKYFSPKYAKYVGKILSKNRNSTIDEWAARTLTDSYTTDTDQRVVFNNLLRLHGNRVALREFQDIAWDSAIIRIKLTTIAWVLGGNPGIWLNEFFAENTPPYSNSHQ